MHDLIIENARIADGLGSPLIEGGIAVDAGRISAVGTVAGPARERLDAQGMVLAPGVVDVHTHYDAQLLWDPTASPSPALGVTTVVIGNCGFGIVPAPADKRARILADLAEVEGMPLASLQQGVQWGFESFAEYLDTLRRQGVYPNVAALASHTTIRTVVMGDDSSRRAATTDEIDAMVDLLVQAMDAGAAGLGSSSNENHRGSGGAPIASRLADSQEFSALAGALARYDHGIFMITTGNHMDMGFMEEFAQASGKPALYAAHFHYPQQPERGRTLMNGAQAARERGHHVYTQGSCQPLSLGFTLDEAYILKMIEGWPSTSDHGQLRRVFSDRDFREKLRRTLAVPDGARIFNGRWEWVIVNRTGKSSLGDLETRSVADIAAEQGVDPLDCFLDIALEDDFATYFTLYMLNMEEDGVEELITNDGTLISLSDAGAHNSLLCDAGYAIHLLSHWVREKGTFDLATAIRKVTSDPADVYGLVDRGRLVPGSHADMILFDPETLRLTEMERHFDLPGDGERLLRRAPGLMGTWINGVRVFDGENYVRLDRGPGDVITTFANQRPTLGMLASSRDAAD